MSAPDRQKADPATTASGWGAGNEREGDRNVCRHGREQERLNRPPTEIDERFPQLVPVLVDRLSDVDEHESAESRTLLPRSGRPGE